MRVPLLLALLACGGSASDVCPDVAGDPALPIEVEVLLLDGEGRMVPAADPDRVALLQPPQGGKVIYAGLRARNLALCDVLVIGSLRDGTRPSDRIVGLEGRPVAMVAAGDGWAYPRQPTQPSSYANIPLCPNHSSTRDIHDHEYQLTVTARDPGGREGSRSIAVTPYCAEPALAAECACTCSDAYVLGDVCPLP